jgi:DNA-binding transcriptional regulator YiaG
MSDTMTVARLVDEFRVPKEAIALRLKVAVRTVERWYAGDTAPYPFYQHALEKMLAAEIRKREKIDA